MCYLPPLGSCRNSVAAVDIAVAKETDSFHPHKQTRLYGITTALSQCPQGNPPGLLLRRGWVPPGHSTHTRAAGHPAGEVRCPPVQGLPCLRLSHMSRTWPEGTRGGRAPSLGLGPEVAAFWKVPPGNVRARSSAALNVHLFR